MHLLQVMERGLLYIHENEYDIASWYQRRTAMSKQCPYCKRQLRVIRGNMRCVNEICSYKKMTKNAYVYDPDAPENELALKILRGDLT